MKITRESLAALTEVEWQDFRHVLRRTAEATKDKGVRSWIEKQLAFFARTHEEQGRFANQTKGKPV